ncbi:Squalene epoxidase 1 [Datura stramonium]|uniref:Squalene monooxygenase n=1 Tax=Datura stramonium TaxID=4076 RepID=A0ABS8S6A0_DATST|nr:Squalene epoxidase 1 [Datura stramonium]
MEMIDEYGLCTLIIPSFFGLILLYINIRRKISKASNVALIKEHEPFDVSLDDGKTDVIIVGAGVAGSALACTLAKDGRRVHVIERDLSEPDRIVGELLQPGGYLKLLDLGLEDCVKDIDAQRIVGQAIYKEEGKHTVVSYPLQKFHADVFARCFHNGRFVQKMREKAATLPNIRLEQGTVTSLIEEKGIVKGVNYKTKDGRQLNAYAPLTIVCDGCFSNLRRYLSNSKVDTTCSIVGLILKDCQLQYTNHAALIMSGSSPMTIYPISSSEIRCMVLIPPPQKLPSIANGEMFNFLKTVVAPQVPPELKDAFLRAAADKGKIRTMQIRNMAVDCRTTPGSLLIGDASNMRHPVTGGGMTVALSDILVLRDLLRPLRDFNDPNAMCKHLQRFYILRKPLASTINTLAGVLFQVVCPSLDPTRKEIREACYSYLTLGGIFSNGVSAIFGGLNPSPLSLAFHFFAMGLYATARLLLQFPSPMGAWRVAKFLYVAFGMIFPIIKAEGIRQMFFPATLLAYYRAPVVAQLIDLLN